MSDLMVDIETLSVLPNATILTIGAQGFDPLSDRFTDVTYYERCDLESQDGRDIDNDTVEWWGKQSADAQEEALGDGNRIALQEALEELSRLIWKADRIWSNGSFDFTILEDAFRQYNMPLPWKYWQVMEMRTILKLTPQVGKLGNNHNALADCVNQIDLLQKSLKILNIKKF